MKQLLTRRNVGWTVAMIWLIFTLRFMLSFNSVPPVPVPIPDSDVPAHRPGGKGSEIPDAGELEFQSFDEQGIEQVRRRFLMVVPSFGPNNQYMATKEAVVLAQILGRDLVQPVYIKHLVKGETGPRMFEETWNATKLDKFLETFQSTSGLEIRGQSKHKIQSVPFDEFKEECNSQLDALFWLRDHGEYWNAELRNYLEVTGLQQPLSQINPIRSVAESGTGSFADKVFLMKQDMVERYFEGYENVRCIGIAFPFRSVGGALFPVVETTHRGFHHTDKVVSLASQAIKQMGTTGEKTMLIHWRHGEATCRVEKEQLHEGFDFCWGTSEYYWARISDTAATLGDWITRCKYGIETIYFATDSKDEQEELQKRGLKMFKASDLPVLSAITDNYYLSLAEQEIALQAKTFLGSGGTTWSEEMINYRRFNYGNAFGTCQLWTLTDLMKSAGKPILTHNYWEHVLKG